MPRIITQQDANNILEQVKVQNEIEAKKARSTGSIYRKKIPYLLLIEDGDDSGGWTCFDNHESAAVAAIFENHVLPRKFILFSKDFWDQAVNGKIECKRSLFTIYRLKKISNEKLSSAPNDGRKYLYEPSRRRSLDCVGQCNNTSHECSVRGDKCLCLDSNALY